MLNWNKKEKPFLGYAGFGGASSGLAGASVGGGQQATGGNQEAIIPGNGYVYHTFTSTGPGTFTVTSPNLSSVDILMIGGGGRAVNGGGGAGALIYKTNVPVSAQAYTVTIGAGGGPVSAPFNGPAGPYPPGEGGPSTALGYTAAGGGHGGVHNQNGMHGDPGGSGGGGAPRNGGGTAGNPGTGSGDSGGTNGSVSPNNGWGNNGGQAHASNPGGYGGGGGGAGGNGSNNAQGAAGAGLAYPEFAGPLLNVPSLPGTYAAGGPKTGQEGTPGSGYWPTNQKIDGTGNGGGHNTSGQPDGSYNGSSGIVIIRYAA